MESWLILEPGQEIHKMGLEHLVSESREVLRKQSPYSDRGVSKRPRRPLRELPMAKTEQSKQEKKVK